MSIEEITAAEPLTEENEQELARLARRYVAVARLLRQRDELRDAVSAYVVDVADGEKYGRLVELVGAQAVAEAYDRAGGAL